MSEEFFTKFMNGGAKLTKKAALKVRKVLLTAAIASGALSSAAQEPTIKDKTEDKKEISVNQSKQEKLTVRTKSFFGLEDVNYYSDGSVDKIDDNETYTDMDLSSTKKQKSSYKKEQKKAFSNAETSVNDTITAQQLYDEMVETGAFEIGHYDNEQKNITLKVLNASEEERRNVAEKSKQKINPRFNQGQNINRFMEKSGELLSEDIRKSTIVHEYEHFINDRNNAYAPGLNAEEYGKLNCWDEVSANVSQLILVNHKYQEKIKNGVSREEALKTFDMAMHGFDFYKEALEKGLNPDSKEAKQLMVQGTVKMWKEKYQPLYEDQIQNYMKYIDSTNIGAAMIGNDADYQKRVQKMFASFDQNPYFKECGIKVGDLSQYLPQEKSANGKETGKIADFHLSQSCKNYAREITFERTGISPEQGKVLSDVLPGAQKKDQKTINNMLKDPQKMEKMNKKYGQRFSMSLAARKANQGR